MSPLKWTSSSRFFIPARNSRHRTACISLYRALLSLAPSVPLPPRLLTIFGPKNPIAHLIRRAFRRNAPDTSPRLVFPALKAGYRMLSLLQNARTPDSTAHKAVISFLDARAAERRATLREKELHPHNSRNPRKPSSAPSPLSKPLLVNVTPEPTAENPNPKPVYTSPHRPRPLSELPKGAVRKVPKLDMADHFPFLRISKPQPAVLSRVLGQLIRKRAARFSQLIEMEEELLPEWKEEDEWDKTVKDLIRRKTGRLSDAERCELDEDDLPAASVTSFRRSIERHGIRYINDVVTRQREDAVARADAMRRLIKQEAALAAQEKELRAVERRRRWEERMEAEHGTDWRAVVAREEEEAKQKAELAAQKAEQRAIVRQEKWEQRMQAEHGSDWRAVLARRAEERSGAQRKEAERPPGRPGPEKTKGPGGPRKDAEKAAPRVKKPRRIYLE